LSELFSTNNSIFITIDLKGDFMKKIIVSMLTLLMAVSLFAGCSDDDDSSNDLGDKAESLIDDTGSLVDEGMDDISKAVD